MSVCSPVTSIACSSSLIRKITLLVFAMLMVLLLPRLTHAQGTSDSHWAVGASFTPKWTSHDSLAENLLNWTGSIEGSEFTIGAGRGSTRGGDWGVSYVHKPFDDGTAAVSVDQNCFGPGNCSTVTQSRVMRNVKLTGVEFHWSRPFVTIKDRVQIGMNLGGGVASTKGSIDETTTFEFVFTNPVTGAVIRDMQTDMANVPASEILYGTVPLIKVEAQAALILHPAVKVKVAGGLNMPSASGVRISAVYLIGAR